MTALWCSIPIWLLMFFELKSEQWGNVCGCKIRPLVCQQRQWVLGTSSANFGKRSSFDIFTFWQHPTPCRPLFLLISFLFFVNHLVHLHVGHYVSHHVGHHNVVSTLCEGSETLTEWKSEKVWHLSAIRRDRLTGVGARDACASKNKSFEIKIHEYLYHIVFARLEVANFEFPFFQEWGVVETSFHLCFPSVQI